MKKIGLAVCTYLFGLALLATASAAVFQFVLSQPGAVKKAIDKSGVYNNFVDVALEESKKKQGDSISSVPLDAPEISAAAKEAFSPQILKQNTEAFIDGTYRWLDGTVTKPDFVLDFSQSKETFAERAGDFAQKRLQGLPRCTSFDQLRQANVLTLTCLPPGLSPALAKEQVTRDLSQDKNFLPNPVFTAQTLAENGQGDSFFDSSSKAPESFQRARTAFWPLLILCFVLAAGIILLNADRLMGVKRVGKNLIISGVFVLLIPLFIQYLLPKIAKVGADSNMNVVDKIAYPLLRELASSAANAYYVFGGLSIIAGVATILIARRLIIKASKVPL